MSVWPIVYQYMGEIPIMLKSKACNWNGMTPKQLMEHENKLGYDKAHNEKS
jgi:hypothetical protein